MAFGSLSSTLDIFLLLQPRGLWTTPQIVTEMSYTIIENIQTQQYKDGMPKSQTRQVANPSDLAEMHPDTGLPRIWVDFSIPHKRK